MKTLKESHFRPLKMSDEDIMKNNINSVFAEKDEIHVPSKNLSTRKIILSCKESVFDETNVFYADFKTCKKYDETLKEYVAVEMMLCVQNYDGTFKRTLKVYVVVIKW